MRTHPFVGTLVSDVSDVSNVSDGTLVTVVPIRASELSKNMREAITLHLRGMVEDHEPIPVPQTRGEYAEVPAPSSAA